MFLFKEITPSKKSINFSTNELEKISCSKNYDDDKNNCYGIKRTTDSDKNVIPFEHKYQLYGITYYASEIGTLKRKDNNREITLNDKEISSFDITISSKQLFRKENNNDDDNRLYLNNLDKEINSYFLFCKIKLIAEFNDGRINIISSSIEYILNTDNSFSVNIIPVSDKLRICVSSLNNLFTEWNGICNIYVIT